MSEPQREIVQMHRRYRYVNGEPAVILTNKAPGIGPVKSMNPDGDVETHDEYGRFGPEGPGLDLVPLPESEQPPAPREFTVIASGWSNELKVVKGHHMKTFTFDMEHIRVREVT